MWLKKHRKAWTRKTDGERRECCVRKRGKKDRTEKDPEEGGGKETEGLFSSGWTSKSLTVLWNTSLSCWIWGSTNQKERKIKGRAKESSGRGRCIIPPSWSWRRWRGCAGRCGGAANRSDNDDAMLLNYEKVIKSASKLLERWINPELE